MRNVSRSMRAAAGPIQVGQVAGATDNGLFEADDLNCLIFTAITAH